MSDICTPAVNNAMEFIMCSMHVQCALRVRMRYGPFHVCWSWVVGVVGDVLYIMHMDVGRAPGASRAGDTLATAEVVSLVTDPWAIRDGRPNASVCSVCWKVGAGRTDSVRGGGADGGHILAIGADPAARAGSHPLETEVISRALCFGR